MVHIDYSLSSLWKLEKNKFDLTQCDIGTLTFDAFTGGIILRINEVDFSAQWDWIPILGFAREFFGTIELLSKKNLVTFSFTENDEEIILERKKPLVQISASYASSNALVVYEELRTTALNFYRKATSDFSDQYPDLKKNANFQKLALEAKDGKIRDRMAKS